MIRVVLADDQALVGEGLRLILDAQPDITVVAEAGTGDDALRAARSLRPDIVLMDIRMPGMDGITATGRLLATADWPVKVMVVTTFDLDEYVVSGAAPWCQRLPAEDRPTPAAADRRPRGPRRRDNAVLAAHPPPHRTIHRAPPPETGDVPAAFAALTARELDVLRLIARGGTNSQIPPNCSSPRPR